MSHVCLAAHADETVGHWVLQLVQQAQSLDLPEHDAIKLWICDVSSTTAG